MNWLNKKSWQKEDDLYSPKRKVNNKGSRDFHLTSLVLSLAVK
jgi:hypothetical protein